MPFCLFTGLIYGFGRGWSRCGRRPRPIVAIPVLLASFATLEWVVPASNQASRVAAARNLRIQRD